MALGIVGDRFGTTRPLRAALLASSALALVSALPTTGPAQAQNATWLANPGSGDFNTGSNWSTGTVPTGTAFFGTSDTTALTLNTNATFGGWTFNAGASNYTFTATYPAWLEFVGAGIVVNGGSVAMTNGHVLVFYNASTAGSASINNTGNLGFYNSSSAGSAAITNHYSLSFGNSSTAGSATIINNSGLGFTDTATAGSATITNNAGQTTVFSNTSTAGSAAITNNGNLYFRDSSSAGSASIANNGTLTIYNAATAGNAVITNSNGSTTVFQGTSTAGNAQLINNGASAVFDFSASTGPNGDNKLSAGSIAGNGTFNLGANELTVGGNNLSTEVTGVIADGGTNGGTGASLVKTGTGVLTLSGDNTYTGGTTISGGTLQIGNGGTTGSVVGNIVNNSALIFNRSDLFTYAGNISGSGTLEKKGTGILELTGTSTYTGGTTITAGLINFAGGSSLGTGNITINGGGLRWGGNSTDISSRLNAIGANGATFDTYGNNVTLATALTGSGGLTKTGLGRLTLSAANTYTGATIIDAGTLEISGSIASSTITNNANLNFRDGGTAGNATITNNGVLQTRYTGSLGNTTITNNAYLYLQETSTAGSATIINNGRIDFYFSSTAANATITNNGIMQFMSAASAGSAHITNSAGDELWVRNLSTLADATVVNSGEIIFDGSSTAGNATITNNATGATVDFSGTTGPNNDNKISAGSLAGNGTFSLGASELTVGSNNLSTTVSGVIADGGTYGGTGASLIKTGTGTLTLTGANTYTGGTTINGGLINFANGGNLGTGNVTLNGGGLQWATGNTTDISSRLNAIGTNGAVFDTNGNNVTLGSVLSGGGGVTKAGAGILELTGTNAYTGGTTITGGLINFAGASSFGSGNITINGGGLRWGGNSTDISGRLNAIGSNGATFDTNGNDVTFATALTGSGGLTKDGLGTLTLTGANTYTGATTINGGVLDIRGSIASSTIANNAELHFRDSGTAGSAAITNNSGGGLSFYNASTAGSATITNNYGMGFYNTSTAGNAAITNNSGGTLAFNNASSAGSATITNSGNLAFSSTSTAGNANIINNNNLIFYGTAGSATITNNSGGNTFFRDSSDGGSARFINNAGSTFDISGLTASGTVAGSIEGAGSHRLGGKTLTVGGNNLSTTVSGVIADGGNSGGTGGALIKTGTGTLTLSGTNSYTGATTIDGGTLAVNSTLTATSGITVNNGGTLGGTGTVGNTTINAGGRLAAGNSIGTLSVSGNLTFNAGSFYMVEVSPTAADRTDVTGTATLTGATVQAIALPGSFRAQTYTILNATGGFGGTQFAGITGSSFAPGARNPHLTYDANNVFLVLDPGAIQLPAGASGSQASVAGGINKAVESGATPPAAFDALLNMSGAQLTNALNQVSGQGASQTTQTGTAANNQFMTAMFDPFAMGRTSTVSSGMSSYASADDAMAYASKKRGRVAKAANDIVAQAVRDDRFEQRWGVWASGYGGSTTTSGNASAGQSDVRSSGFGVVAGADYRVTPQTMVGFALGGGGSSFAVSQGLGSGSADMFQAGLFARHDMGAAYLTGGFSYTYQDVTTSRTVTVSGSEQLQAKFNANTFSGRVEGGYRFDTAVAAIAPYAALQVTQINLPGYTETAKNGSSAFALTYGSNDTTITRTELGARIERAFALEAALLTLRGRAAWAHDEGNNGVVSATFASLPGATFTMNGLVPAKDLALVSAGAELQLANNVIIGGSFEGEFSNTTRGYGGKGSVRYVW